jgi:hypothetical protein
MHRARCTIEMGIAVGEDPTIGCNQPVSTGGGCRSHAHDGFVQVKRSGGAVNGVNPPNEKTPPSAVAIQYPSVLPKTVVCRPRAIRTPGACNCVLERSLFESGAEPSVLSSLGPNVRINPVREEVEVVSGCIWEHGLLRELWKWALREVPTYFPYSPPFRLLLLRHQIVGRPQNLERESSGFTGTRNLETPALARNAPVRPPLRVSDGRTRHARLGRRPRRQAFWGNRHTAAFADPVATGIESGEGAVELTEVGLRFEE